MVEGQNGTVLITSDPALRFRTSDAGSEEGDLSALLGGAQIAAAVPIAVEGWKLVHAEPRAVALGGVVPIARLAGALAAIASGLCTGAMVDLQQLRAELELYALRRGQQTHGGGAGALSAMAAPTAEGGASLPPLASVIAASGSVNELKLLRALRVLCSLHSTPPPPPPPPPAAGVAASTPGGGAVPV